MLCQLSAVNFLLFVDVSQPRVKQTNKQKQQQQQQQKTTTTKKGLFYHVHSRSLNSADVLQLLSAISDLE